MRFDFTERDGAENGSYAGDATGQAATEEMLIRAITASGKYRLISRLERRPYYHRPDGTATKPALLVDVETTGVGEEDRVIQLAVLPFEFDPATGRIFAVGECEAWFDDPGMPIPDEVTRLTGITQADVDGEYIDEARVFELLDRAVLVIAHNARFDRPKLEARIPAFAEKHWGCSCDDVPWIAEGLQSAKLEWLAFKACGVYYEAHRADADCLMAVHLLATALPSGALAMNELLKAARQRTARVWAVRSDISTKGRLKQRGYRWNGDDDGRPRAWWRDVPEPLLDEEIAWLAQHVYDGQPRHRVQIFDSRFRFSSRVAQLEYVDWAG